MNIAKLIEDLVAKVQGWGESFILMLPNLGVAILTVILFYGLSRLVRKFSRKLVARISDNRAIIRLSTTIASFTVLIVGLFIALSILDLDKAVTSLLAGAGVIGIALGFAFQDLSANFLSGVIIGLRKPYKIDDHILTNSLEGIVTDISLRNTVIRTFQGQEVLIPNRMVYQTPLINFTSRNERRVDLVVGVSYADDLEKVEEVTRNAVAEADGVDTDRDVNVFYHEFGSSSVNFTVQFWVNLCRQAGFLGARSNAIKAIRGAYRDHGITIPFPIRTLDFGIEGGKNLKSMLSDTAPAPGRSGPQG